MQLIGKQKSLRTSIRPTEDFHVLTIEVQPIFKHMNSIRNEIRVSRDRFLGSFISMYL